jgi:glycosyltransferase involved in cell wall biosynthesis
VTAATDAVTLSACLVVRNEEAVIERCLRSVVNVADETIVVHDGPCSDRTIEIAQGLGCRVTVRPYVGNPEYHTVFAYQEALGQWLLTLDADEFLSAELAAIIPQLIRDGSYNGWEFQWPMWDGQRYITRRGPYKLSLFRRADTSLVGHLQSSERVRGRIGRRDETLHHRPLYNNFTFRSAATKWNRWCRVQARELVEPLSELPTFNYDGPDHWPWQRRVMNLLSPVLALPNGLAHFLLGIITPIRRHTDVNVRLAFFQGVYASLLQLHVARYLYVDRPLRTIDEARRVRREPKRNG